MYQKQGILYYKHGEICRYITRKRMVVSRETMKTVGACFCIILCCFCAVWAVLCCFCAVFASFYAVFVLFLHHSMLFYAVFCAVYASFYAAFVLNNDEFGRAVLPAPQGAAHPARPPKIYSSKIYSPRGHAARRGAPRRRRRAAPEPEPRGAPARAVGLHELPSRARHSEHLVYGTSLH